MYNNFPNYVKRYHIFSLPVLEINIYESGKQLSQLYPYLCTKFQ